MPRLDCGSHQEQAAHEIAMRINAKLGNVGKTLLLVENQDPLASVETIKLNEFVSNVAKSAYRTVLDLRPESCLYCRR